MTSLNWVTVSLFIAGSLVGGFLPDDADVDPETHAAEETPPKEQPAEGTDSPAQPAWKLASPDSNSKLVDLSGRVNLNGITWAGQDLDAGMYWVHMNNADNHDNLAILPLTWSINGSDRNVIEATVLGVHVSKTEAVLRKHLKINGEFGLIVDHVEPASAAADANFQQFDVLYEFDNQKLVNREQLVTVVRSHQPGDRVPVSLIREGQAMQLEVVLKSGSVPANEDQPVTHPSQLQIDPHDHIADVRFRQCATCHTGPINVHH